MIFFRGCDYNCYFCQNKDLQDGENLVPMEEVEQKIEESYPFISEVIFSGGEAMLQPKVVRELAIFSKFLGLKVGLETSGYNDTKTFKLLKDNLIDEVFLDMKTFGLEEYYKLTGSRLAWDSVLKTISACLKFQVPLEIRTTVFKDYPGEKNVMKIENFINDQELNWKKQEGRVFQ
jgi:pyruvate formate lyase activating enzyme